jgi:peptidoglycan glycosyltransferase
MWRWAVLAGCLFGCSPPPTAGVQSAAMVDTKAAPILDDTLHELGPRTFDASLERYLAPRGEHLAALTLHPGLHRRLTEELEEGKVLWGAAVVVELSTGRVLAMAEHSEREPDRPVATRPVGPAASVFKIVSAAALSRVGAPLEEKVCYGARGKRRLSPEVLIPSRRDRRCLLGEDVLAYSANVAMARLAEQWLTGPLLRAEARRFGFGERLLSEVPFEPSVAAIPDGAFEVANAAAGFGDVRLGALHAAALAAVFAQGGWWVTPTLIDGVSGGPPQPRPPPRQLLLPDDAAAVADMMRDAVSKGTARSYQTLPDAAPLPAGKTGTLMDYEAHLDHTWFVGFAPSDAPTFAFAVNVVNDWNLWYVKAKDIARRLLVIYGEEQPQATERPLDPNVFRSADPVTLSTWSPRR